MNDTHLLLEDKMLRGEPRNNPLAMVIGFLMLGGSSGEAALKVLEGSTGEPLRDAAGTVGCQGLIENLRKQHSHYF